MIVEVVEEVKVLVSQVAQEATTVVIERYLKKLNLSSLLHIYVQVRTNCICTYSERSAGL